MGVFKVGQRWVSEMELALGLGTVRAVTRRTVEIHFAASACTRVYAMADAPLRRAAFMAGDVVRSRDGAPFAIGSVSDIDGMLVYHGAMGDLSETELDDAISFTTPRIRLLGGMIDHNRDFRMRYRALSLRKRIDQSPVRGFMGGRISLIPHQLSVAHAVTSRAAPRVLLSDEIGLGKTIEACLVLQRLILCGRIERVLILVPQTLQHQWFAELVRKFNIVFRIFDREYQKSIRAADANRNPFLEDQCFIAAIEYVAADERARAQAVEAGWDLAIVDEAHHLAEGGPEYELVKRLGAISPGLILLTATPEQFGHRSHFARMHLLDHARYHDFDAFEKDEARYESVTRLANAVMNGETPDRNDLRAMASMLGEGARELGEKIAGGDESWRRRFVADLVDRFGTGRAIFRNTREGMTGFPEREVSLVPLDGTDADRERLRAEYAADAAGDPDAVRHEFDGDPRCAWLAAYLRKNPGRKTLLLCRSAGKTVAIERFLRKAGFSGVALFHEGLAILQRDRNAGWFAMEDGAQLLVSSEIGSEGRNFQFAHDLVMFDLPLDPELLEQRIGRLDRIGQETSINIHVPFVGGSEYALLARWYHEGVNGFAGVVPGAYEIGREFGELIAGIVAKRDLPSLEELIPRTRAFREEIAAKLRSGRDRLLELNSFDPAAAAAVLGEIELVEVDGELEDFMQDAFEYFNIVAEPLAGRTYRLRLDMMTTDEFPLPPLGRDDLRVTFQRETALRHEDLEFLTWDHPMVTGALDLILSAQKGNCALAAWHDPANPELLLEAVFVAECVAPKRLHADRFLPPRPLRVVVNSALRDRTGALTTELCDERLEQYADLEVLNDHDIKNDMLPKMLGRCSQIAGEALPGIVDEGLRAIEGSLVKDLDRLTALQRINANIGESEIASAEREIDELRNAIRSARLRLDSLRLICKGDLEGG